MMTPRSIIASLAAWILNRYEAGQRHTTKRSYLPGYVQDSRFDADQATRTEILRKARYFERNSAIVQRWLDLFEAYTVGSSGLRFVPSTEDEDWNRLATEWWDGWQRVCDIASRQHFSTLQSLIARSWFVDGEVFILKTSGSEVLGPRGQLVRRPRIQLIESHRVETPAERWLDEGRTIVDGIEIDPNSMRPVAYHVRNSGPDDGVIGYRRYEADQIIHVYEPARPGMMRGLSFLYAVMNDLHDLDDLQVFEMQAAKHAASITGVVENEAGEINSDQARRSRFNPNAGTAEEGNSGGSSDDRYRHYENITGSRILAMRKGEKFHFEGTSRPTVSTREYWDYITSKVCAGVGISKLLVFPWSMQGTVTRADLDVQAAFFRSRSEVLIHAFAEVYRYVMNWATSYEVTLADRPPGWDKPRVRAPRSVNVDVGRNSSALIAEYEAGFRTLESICGEMGEDWREVVMDKAKEEAFIDEAAAMFGTSPERIKKGLITHAERLRNATDAYGVGVRAGVLTPNVEDEAYMREQFGLPPVPAEVRRAWTDEDGVRKPVTLQQDSAQSAPVAPTMGGAE